MKRLLPITLFFLSLFLASHSSYGQQFKWVKGGGSTEDFSSGPSNQWEGAKYMCTDHDGNVYVLSQVGNYGISADTFTRSTAYGADGNMLLTSYNCSGQMRWAKLLANNGYGCFPLGMAADSLGNIFVAGSFAAEGGIFHIGNDTTIGPPSSNYLSLGLIRFDTGGNFKWIRYVGPNTFASEIKLTTSGDALVMDGSNNAHFFCYIGVGVPLTSSVTTTLAGTYELSYNTAGVLFNAVRLDLDSEWFFHGGVIDPATNKLYAYGEIYNGIYGGFLTDTFYASAFDASRNLLWMYFCGHGDDDGFSGLVMDDSKHLYFSGGSQSTVFSFNGDSVSAPGFGDIGVIMKTDTNGHPEWFRHFDSHLDVNSLVGITLLPNAKTASIGTYAGTLYANGSSAETLAAGPGWNPYFVVLDSAGDLQTMQTVTADGFYKSGDVITSDNVGNVYIGGEVADSITAGSPAIPAYHSVGGNTDFFVMKYGVDCSCTSSPTASYTSTGAHNTLNVTYTGTTAGIDSVIWNFDDGSTATGTTATHTYTATGTYRVCVTVYTDCGSDLQCKDVVVPIPSTGVTTVAGNQVSVYPNPATDQLNISGVADNMAYRLLTVTGVSMAHGSLHQGSNSVSMNTFAPGIYLLEMTGTDGERGIVRVVKE